MSLISSRLVAPPAAPLIEAAQLRRHVRELGDIEDVEAAAFCAAAEQALDGPDGMLQRALVEQTWEWDFEWPTLQTWLPLAPIIEIETVTDDIGVIVIRNNWLRFERSAALVTVRAKVGYGEASKVPAPIFQAAIIMAAESDKQRDATIEGAAVEAPFGVTSKLAPYRRMIV